MLILAQREERWNEWKNKSCPEIKKPNSVHVDFKESGRKEKFLGDILKEYSNRKKYFMGRLALKFVRSNFLKCQLVGKNDGWLLFSKSLTLLWNNKPDNMDACRSADRNFTPSVDNYFKDAIEQADPTAMIEPQYK